MIAAITATGMLDALARAGVAACGVAAGLGDPC